MRKPNPNLISKITELNANGLNDYEIAKELGIKGNLAHHYRSRILNLPANWIKNDYQSEEDRIRGYIIRNLKCNAKRRQLDFDLHWKDIELPQTCPLLGIPLDYYNSNNSPNHATVDRIDNSLGYIKGNVWIVSRLANTMKSSASFDELETFSHAILKVIQNRRARGGITDSESLGP